jgi:hypothetical protein
MQKSISRRKTLGFAAADFESPVVFRAFKVTGTPGVPVTSSLNRS